MLSVEDFLLTLWQVEFEPEYELGNIVSNPDINDTPLPPLKDALESAKDELMELCGMKTEDEFQVLLCYSAFCLCSAWL